MAEASNLIGQKFGRLTVIARAENNKRGQTRWLCKCECGNEKIVGAYLLKSGQTKSCGCLKKEKFTHKKHGLRYTRIYKLWLSIKQRCYNPKELVYKHYGGRGIAMCEEWKNNFMSFHDWAFANGYDENVKRGECTIDRIDTNGNYEPSNCRWVTQKEQANNKRNNVLLTYKGNTHTAQQWAEILDIKYITLITRLKRGWSVEKTLTTPLRGNK